MNFIENQYYHIYNRTNNNEALFRNRENYLYFLKKYRYYFDDVFDTIAYCLMPTHFHFLVRVKTFQESQALDVINVKINIWLRSYTQAYNKMFSRNGSLFQPHTKAKLVDDELYFLALATYIHQNPIRSKLVEFPEEWEFSSYQDYIELRKGSLPKKDLLLERYSISQIKEFSEKKIENITAKYWV